MGPAAITQLARCALGTFKVVTVLPGTVQYLDPAAGDLRVRRQCESDNFSPDGRLRELVLLSWSRGTAGRVV